MLRGAVAKDSDCIARSGELPNEAYWEARGQVVEFAGYTRYWNNLSADSQLPTVRQGQILTLKKAQADQKQTQPPPRYTEPKLVQLMEKQGIGRPSTYAPTIKVLRSRDYVHSLKDKLQPTALGLSLDAALEELLPDLIQPEFTAKMEGDLDAIAAGKQEWQAYLTGWHREYFAPAIAEARRKLSAGVITTLAAPSEQFDQKTIRGGVIKSANARRVQKNVDKSSRVETRAKIQTKAKEQKSQVNCPKCAQPLNKIPSKSKKLKANHFLKCGDPLCDTVMFWNPSKKEL